MGFRVFVSPLQPSKAFLPSKGTRAGAAGGASVCAAPAELQPPECVARGSWGKAGQGGAVPSGSCSPAASAWLRGRGQLSKHLSVPWEAAMTPLSTAPLRVLQGSCTGDGWRRHGRDLKVRIS